MRSRAARLGAVLAAAGVTLVKELASVEAPGIFRLFFGASILPRGHEVGIDLKMFGIAFSIAALTSLVFGVLPALHLSRTRQLPAMASRGGGAGRGESRIRGALVVGQLLMATVLLVGAGLLAHSFVKLSTVERGYDPSNVLAFQLVFPPDYSIARKTSTIEALLARLRAMPGVTSAGFTRAGVLIPEEIFVGTFVPRGRTLDEMRADPTHPRLRPVSHGYLTAIGARVLDGRELAAADAAPAPPAIVISRIVARRYFGAGSPVGQFVDWHVGKAPAVQLQVVGVVEDVRNESPGHEPNPDIFIDYRQLLALQQRWGDSPPAAGRDVDRVPVLCRPHPGRAPGRRAGGRPDRAFRRSQCRHRRDDSDGSTRGELCRPAALLRGAARRVRRALRAFSRRWAFTACSPMP